MEVGIFCVFLFIEIHFHDWKNYMIDILVNKLYIQLVDYIWYEIYLYKNTHFFFIKAFFIFNINLCLIHKSRVKIKFLKQK